MRKASLVLGIVGSSISLLVGFIVFLSAVIVLNLPDNDVTAYEDALTSLLTGALALTGGIAGVIGCANLHRKRVLSGALLIVGGTLSVASAIGFPSGIVLVLGGIFALVRQPLPPAAAYSPLYAPPNPPDGLPQPPPPEAVLSSPPAPPPSVPQPTKNEIAQQPQAAPAAVPPQAARADNAPEAATTPPSNTPAPTFETPDYSQGDET
jgi:hypothetical protein